MSELPWSNFVTVLLGSGVIAAVPLLLAALGETLAERAGLLNLGLEGMMLLAAFGAFYAALQSGSPLVGLLAGPFVGLTVGLLFGFLAIGLRVDQVIIGLGLTIFAEGLTGTLFRYFYGRQFPTLSGNPARISLPLLSQIPIVGPALFNQQAVVYLAWLLVIFFSLLLSRTRFGLAVRAVGESPFAADAAGVNVPGVRYLAIAIGGSMAGLGGAFLAVGDLNFFVPGMTAGMGFIAIAVTMLGRWSPYRVGLGALLFGFLRSLANGLQVVGLEIQPEFTLMLPYLGIIAAMVVLAGRTTLPAALAVSYQRGQKSIKPEES